ncbi:MAG: hypothetical protein ACN4GR_17305 [Arenicellales bacterium]
MCLIPATVLADAAAEMARKAQDPLGNVKAIMTDNTIAFGGGPEDDTAYGFQIQPVYAIENDTPFNMLARAVIPVVGVEPGVVLPPIGPEPRPEEGDTWGLSDTILQYFFSPKATEGYKWGIGPQVSLKTRTSERQAGPGWGAGVAAVVFGGVNNWALGTVAFQHWGEDDFSLLSVQPIVLYNFDSLPGAYLGYNNSIAYNWNASSGDKLTVPAGLTFGRTILLGNGDGLDLSLGVYDLVERPQDGPEWQFKFGVSYYFN